jgi:hypothetical protein
MLIRVLLLLALTSLHCSHAWAHRAPPTSRTIRPAVQVQRESAFDILFPGVAAYSTATDETELSGRWQSGGPELNRRNLLNFAAGGNDASTTNEESSRENKDASKENNSASNKRTTRKQTKDKIRGSKSRSAASSEDKSSFPEDEDPKVRVLGLQMELKSKAETVQRYKRKQKYLEKSLALKKAQALSHLSETELNEDELQTSARMLKSSMREASDLSAKYSALLAEKAEMQGKNTSLVEKLVALVNSKREFEIKLQELTLEEIVEKHTVGLPGSMAGAIRKSADALTPFFDTLVVVAETNQRLVDHVGSEIDKYTHVNVRKSPFLHGLLFYAVLMVPAMTVAAFLRRIVDTSSKLTVSHVVILGNMYFLVLCALCTIEGLLRRHDPAANLYKKHERFFVAFNLILAMYYTWHVCMLALQAVYTRRRRDWAQVLSTTCVGIHYYLFTWQRVFTNSSPRMITANYVVYATIFSFILYERSHRIDVPWLMDNKFTQFLKQRLPGPAWPQILPNLNLDALIKHVSAAALRLRALYRTPRIRARARGALQRSRSFNGDGKYDTESELEFRDGNASDDEHQSRSTRPRRFVKSDVSTQNKSGLTSFLFGGKAAARPAGSSDSDAGVYSDESSSEEELPTAYFTSLGNMWRNGRDRLLSGWWQSSGQRTNLYRHSKESRRDQIDRSHSGRVGNKRK